MGVGLFFEEVVRENLDMGRPDHVQLIFDRRVSRRTPSRYRTRVITDGVIPSLHVDYKHSRIKQYHKEGRALRTETVINDTYDFDVGRRLRNLVQRLSHDCTLGADVLDELHRPVCVDGQRASALRFGDRRVQALFAALLRNPEDLERPIRRKVNTESGEVEQQIRDVEHRIRGS